MKRQEKNLFGHAKSEHSKPKTMHSATQNAMSREEWLRQERERSKRTYEWALKNGRLTERP
ncbi:hypothetical protein [Mesorhizobium huakuii]|uniref:Uncharacterized protein n=1 Tax=Mesorhizobium huakuii TaxID=28104 RepID=A0A7G6T055_9HYPH|nr:hypothetical protein [Mesorhizobium huakuii]QND60137.1 hypothetical protein HB778_29025 [Mesorhizobium huakuii]